MRTYYVIIIIFGILTSILIISLSFVNRILNKKNKIDLLFKNVINYIDERVALIERITNFVEESIEEEVNFVTKLNNTNEELTKLVEKNTFGEKEVNKSEKILEKFAELREIYSYLDKNELYKILVNENQTNIERIEYALSTYNDKVVEYNKFRQTKINSFISKILRLSDYDVYKK